MPRYYFDLTDGQDQYTDEDGEELEDDREARSCGRAVLTNNVGRLAMQMVRSMSGYATTMEFDLRQNSASA